MTNLERENATFHQKLPELMAHEGKFALVLGEEVIGTFDTYSDAIKAGYEKAGLNPFLVKKISMVEASAHYSRPLRLCRA